MPRKKRKQQNEVFSGNEGLSSVATIILVLFAITLVGLIIWGLQNTEVEDDLVDENNMEENNGSNNQDNMIAWETYRNEEYNFEIQHPEDWAVAASSEDASLIFSVYQEGQTTEQNPPFTHFANATHVSIYPEGLGTEGVVGEQEDANLPISEEVEQMTNFILADDDVWASMITFSGAPPSWNEFGYVWASVAIEDLEVFCEIGGEVIAIEDCDPLTNPGAVVVREGEISNNERETIQEMLSTFRFVNES